MIEIDDATDMRILRVEGETRDGRYLIVRPDLAERSTARERFAVPDVERDQLGLDRSIQDHAEYECQPAG